MTMEEEPRNAAIRVVVKLDAHHGHVSGDAGEVIARVSLQE